MRATRGKPIENLTAAPEQAVTELLRKWLRESLLHLVRPRGLRLTR